MGSQQSTVGGVGRTKSLDESRSSAGGSFDDPTLRSNNGSTTHRSRMDRNQRSKSTLVIVNAGGGEFRLSEDPLFKKLDQLPAFVPLMYEVEHGSKLFGEGSRALKEIQGKIDSTPFVQIVRLYEEKLRRAADSVSYDQSLISKGVKEADAATTALFKGYTERQRKFAKHAEALGRMSDMAHSLSKCQMVLHECKHSVDLLNGMLPMEERLEPFVWCDNEDDDGVTGQGQSSSDKGRKRVS